MGLNAWQRSQFFQQALIKRDDPLWCGILPLRQTDLKAQDTLKAKSGLDLLQLIKATQQQSGTDEQQQGDSNLRHDQSMA